jgi:hypothetical protein
VNRELARTVRERADERCEYCRIPQFALPLPFQIDHILAEQHEGKTVSSNLALACPHCNRYKGPNIAGVDPESGQIVRLFHPRMSNATLNGSSSFLVRAEAQKGEKVFYFSEIETMLTFFVKARLGVFWYSINCLVFFTICAIRTQPAAPRTRKSHNWCEQIHWQPAIVRAVLLRSHRPTELQAEPN